VEVQGTAVGQEALELTLAEVAPGQRTAVDVPVILIPVDASQRVHAIDVYATGGRIGHLPEEAVLAVGEALRTTQLAEDRPCAVMSRIAPDPSGMLGAEVLMPDTFVPGTRPR
jgi:hypothetical protein